MLKPGNTYKEVISNFRWEIPEHYNIGVDICDKWARQPDRLALIYENESGQVETYTFQDLKRLSNRLANGRKDDVITSAGYRIGPDEIEDCIMKHPAVGMVAVVGSPDDVRTEIVKAFIVLKAEITPNSDWKKDIKAFVKRRRKDLE